MTASKEMPETIWAGRTDGYGGWHEGKDFVNDRPYHRHDASPETVATMPGAQVLVAAMIEAAAELVNPQEWVEEVQWAISDTQDSIRALAPYALAHLARRDAEMRAEGRKAGMLEAVWICRLRIMMNSPADDQDQAVAVDEAEVIEAAILRAAAAPADASGEGK